MTVADRPAASSDGITLRGPDGVGTRPEKPRNMIRSGSYHYGQVEPFQANRAMSKDSIRIIKKYPNRRIYDTQDSKYITLDAVREMVVQGIEFKVIDTQSKKDITRSILLQIIIEQESDSNPLFSTDNLQNFIRYYGANQGQGFSDFLNQSLDFFQQQQEQFQNQMSEMMEHSPVKMWSDMSRRNMAMWQDMQGAIFGGSAKKKDDQSD